jgi:hypothetical protein
MLAIRNLKNVSEKTGNSIMENFPAMKAPEKNSEDITIMFLSNRVLNELILNKLILLFDCAMGLPPKNKWL